MPSTSPKGAPQQADGEALIADDERLAASIAALGACVGVDTEFMRVRTFHPIPALYQLADSSTVALVDAKAQATFDALKALLLDPSRIKIMHSCSEDLEVIARHFDLRPRNLVDTQIAHAFLSPNFGPSYATLVEHYAGVALPKHETRSDWLQRPLTAQQLAYAREDAIYLLPIWEAQRQALARLGRLSWFDEEMRLLLATPPDTPETWYRNLKGIARLNARQLAVLRSLVAWREREARRRDLPRAWTVPDDALFTMARRERLSAADVLPLLPRRIARRYAGNLVEAHSQGLDDADPPKPPRPLRRPDNDALRALRTAAQAEAERLGMAPQLLARKRDLEHVVRHHRQFGELPEAYRGWRGARVGDAFRDVLAGKR